jgi:hypothetical protein
VKVLKGNLPHYPRSYSKLPTSKPRTHFCSEEGTGSRQKTKFELQKLSITLVLSLVGSIVLCSCVLKAAMTTQFKKILTLIMYQPLIFIGEILSERKIYNLKI